MSALPRLTDIVGSISHVRKAPDAEVVLGSLSESRSLRGAAQGPKRLPMLFKNFLNNLFRYRFLGGEEKVINDGIVAISHRQWIGNELKACHFLKSLLKGFHDRRVVLFDKLRLGKKLPWSLST